ncbi:hypothetical protein ACFQDG_04525 [Natronoarchaeum mannanilyticum]
MAVCSDRRSVGIESTAVATMNGIAVKRDARFHRLELGSGHFLTSATHTSMARASPSDRSEDANEDRLTATVSRRSIGRAVAAMGLPLTAGCSAITGALGGDPGEVTVFNDTDSSVTATVTVTNIGAEDEVLADTADIDAAAAAKYDDVFESATRYRFAVETTSGLSDSYEWELPSTDHYLYITISGDSIEFEENEP